MATGSRLIVFHLGGSGAEVAERIRLSHPEAEIVRYSSGQVSHAWPSARALIFVMAAGIAVRAIAPHLDDKAKDPAVLVVDELARHIISLAGGHEAGANALAEGIARALGAAPVITTGTDANGLHAIDVFAVEHGLLIEDRSRLAPVSARHIENGMLRIYSEPELDMPPDYFTLQSPEGADVVVSHRELGTPALRLTPRNLVLGIGLNSGTGADEIERAVKELLGKEKVSVNALSLIATHEKKTREPGLVEYSRRMGLPVVGFTGDELNGVQGVRESAAAMKALGVKAVAEPSALLASGARRLLVEKAKSGNVTLALCLDIRKKLYVVGTGPGGLEHMTPEAINAIRRAEHIVGFKSYLGLIGPLIRDKQVHAFSMTQEVERVNAALDLALSGKKTAVISGGDPGIYAMAGLVYEAVGSRSAPVEVVVVPGVSALNACAARLGAPLMHDFCAISLSDRLTPWDLIEQRLEAAAAADFVIVLYNPRSRGRATQIGRAREIALRHRAPSTPVGIVNSAMRAEEEIFVCDLATMLDYDINMKSTVIIGNSQSFRRHGRMVTPRGYGNKYHV